MGKRMPQHEICILQLARISLSGQNVVPED